jgi:FAD/FMN-containing dehydrogenase
MIDLRLLRVVHVDPDALSAVVGDGCCWNDVDAATQAHRLAMPGGTYGDTGVAGLTLSGGIGHLIGAFGLTLDNMLSAEVVTAGGEVIAASADRETELFWALRGGGGNFGVVTSFAFRLHAVPLMTGGVLIHRLEEAADVLKAWARMLDAAPDELTCMPALTDLELVARVSGAAPLPRQRRCGGRGLGERDLHPQGRRSLH